MYKNLLSETLQFAMLEVNSSRIKPLTIADEAEAFICNKKMYIIKNQELE